MEDQKNTQKDNREESRLWLKNIATDYMKDASLFTKVEQHRFKKPL